MNEFIKPFYQADLGVSIRKVSNGYSMKINHSVNKKDIGRIIIAQDKDEALMILKQIFDDNESYPAGEGDSSYFGGFQRGDQA